MFTGAFLLRVCVTYINYDFVTKSKTDICKGVYSNKLYKTRERKRELF